MRGQFSTDVATRQTKWPGTRRTMWPFGLAADPWLRNLKCCTAFVCICLSLAQTLAAPALDYIDTSFENASPIWHQTRSDGVIELNLLYDHERSSPNRAAGHFHFRIVAKTGTELRFELKNLDNVWNGRPGSVARELKNAVISSDGRTWRSFPIKSMGPDRVGFEITMPADSLYVARVEPYRLSDLEKLLAQLKRWRNVEITTIGKTVEGRPLEIVRIGSEVAPGRIFLRARAHPWEAGGNWVVEGLIHRLLSRDQAAKKFLDRYTVWIMPMAIKDGVARGLTRFNLKGKDLNRNWDRPTDPELAPENFALESWLTSMIRRGRKPQLALELHNDGSGLLHISRPPVPQLQEHLERMRLLEQLLRKYTWFTEGSTAGNFRNSGTLGDGGWNALA